MLHEITIERIEDQFDSLFEELNKLDKDLTEKNSVSLRQIYDSYKESKEQ